MIIFSHIHEIKEVMMTQRPWLHYNFYEFNLSMPINYGYNLEALIPDDSDITWQAFDNREESSEFDNEYARFVVSNIHQFMTFMNIVLPLYDDPEACVIIYVSMSPFRDAIKDSLMKLIQQRYGYSSYEVFTYEDIDYLQDNMAFSPRGIVNIQNDSELALVNGYYGAITIPEEE